MTNLTEAAFTLFDLMNSAERATCLRRLSGQPKPDRPTRKPTVVELWWRDNLLAGRVVPGDEAWPRQIENARLVESFLNSAHGAAYRNMSRRGVETALGRALRKVCPSACVSRPVVREDGIRQRPLARLLPDLERAREEWERAFGTEKWPRH